MSLVVEKLLTGLVVEIKIFHVVSPRKLNV